MTRRTVDGLRLASMAVGLALILSAGMLVAHNRAEDARAGLAASELAAKAETGIGSSPMAAYLSDPEFIPDYKLNPGMDLPVSDIDGLACVGTLSVPVLGLELPVQSEWSYPNLKSSPCRYLGTPYTGSMSICAHNYKSHFGAIGSLAPGDTVTFTDMDGNIFDYEVVSVDEIDPFPDLPVRDSEHDLVLFTCTLGGRTRIAVSCDKI